MSDIPRQALFGKLNPLAYQAIESATVFCKLRGNPYVEVVHWLTQLLEAPQSDVQAIVRHHGLDAAVLARDVTTALDRLPRGSTAIQDFAEGVTLAVQQAWVYATLMYGDAQVRSPATCWWRCCPPPRCARRCWASRASSRRSAPTRWPTNCPRLCAGKTAEAGLRAQDGSALRRPGPARADDHRAGRAGPPGGAEPLHGRPDREGARRARSIPSPAATTRSASWSTS